MTTKKGRMDSIELSRIRAVSEKVRMYESQGKNIIKLQVGEPDFDTPSHIIDAAKEALDVGETHYGPNRGIVSLRNSIAQKLMNDNNIQASPESDIIITAGAVEALYITFLGLLEPGDEVIIIEPAFANYLQLARLAGAIPVIVQAKEENEWLPEISDIKEKITAKTKMIIINSPTNPTGAVYPKTLLEEIATIAIGNDILVLSDEIYEKIIFKGNTHMSIASLPGMSERTITVNGFSKAYAMTGWRIGYVVANKDLIIALLKVHQYVAACASTFSQFGALAAIKGSQNCVSDMVDIYYKRCELVVQGLKEIKGFSCIPPKGSFYAYANISKFGLESPKFIDMVLKEAGVAFVPGTAFSSNGEDYVRLSFASSYDNLIEALERLKKLVKG